MIASQPRAHEWRRPSSERFGVARGGILKMTELAFGRDVLDNPDRSSRLEWLVTNGIGGFAAGTLSGALTRRYHGLLFAALKPPLGRTLLLSKLSEALELD